MSLELPGSYEKGHLMYHTVKQLVSHLFDLYHTVKQVLNKS